MAAQLTRVPAIEGWFTLDADAPALLGATCASCSTIVFPPRAGACPNPSCNGTELTPAPLGRFGRIWSYTTNHYAPPPPYIAADPFEPFTAAAVELADERLVVLGQMVPGTDPATLSVGQEVEVALGTLYTDDDNEYLMWQWAPRSDA